MTTFLDAFAVDSMSDWDEIGATDFFWDDPTDAVKRTLTTPEAWMLHKTRSPGENQRFRMKYRTTATRTGQYAVILKSQGDTTHIRGEAQAGATGTGMQIESVLDGIVQSTARPLDLAATSNPQHAATADHWLELEIADDTVALRWSLVDPASNPWTYDSGFITLTGVNMAFDHRFEGRVGFLFRPNSTGHLVHEFGGTGTEIVPNDAPFDAGPADFSIPVPYDEDNYPPADWMPLDPDSTFNTPLPDSPRLHPRSQQICDNLRATTPAQSGGPQQLIVGNPNEFSVPLYFGKSGDSLYTLTHDGQFISPISGWDLHNVQIRVPAGAEAATGSDAHLCVIQPDGKVYEFWEAVINHTAHTIVSGAGAMYDSIYQRHVGGTGGGHSEPDGTTQFGPDLPPITIDAMGIAGLIWPEELRAGEINHALAMVVKCVNRTPNHTYPGRSTALACSVQTDQAFAGQRFFLDYTDEEIDALALDNWQRPIIRAMARYGMINVDTTNNRWGLRGFIAPQTFTAMGWDEPMVKLAVEEIADGATNIVYSSGSYFFRTHQDVDWSRLKACDLVEGQKLP